MTYDNFQGVNPCTGEVGFVRILLLFLKVTWELIKSKIQVHDWGMYPGSQEVDISVKSLDVFSHLFHLPLTGLRTSFLSRRIREKSSLWLTSKGDLFIFCVLWRVEMMKVISLGSDDGQVTWCSVAVPTPSPPWQTVSWNTEGIFFPL